MFGSLIPGRKKETEHPMVSLKSRMDQLFDEFFRGFQEPMGLWSTPFASLEKSDFVPRVDVSENEKEIQLHAELPGMTEKDIQLTLDNGMLVVRGEKKQEEEQKDKNYHCIERRYGSFYRSVPITCEVETDKIEASFRNGVLSVVIPKKHSAEKSTKIEIKVK